MLYENLVLFYTYYLHQNLYIEANSDIYFYKDIFSEMGLYADNDEDIHIDNVSYTNDNTERTIDIFEHDPSKYFEVITKTVFSLFD